MSSSPDGLNLDGIRERAQNDEPLVDPQLLETWRQLNLPLRGPLRNEVLDGLVEAAAQRRTVSGISSRVANQMVSPITNTIQEQLEGRVQQRLGEAIQNAASEEQGVNDMTPIRMGPGIIRDLEGEDGGN